MSLVRRLSLRARLLAALLGLAAVALMAVGGVTYAQQRSFLLHRIDDQARSAAPVMGRVLDEQGVAHPGRSEGHGGSPPGGPFGSGGRAPRDGETGRGGDPRGGGDPDGRGEGPPPEALPPGTYGERRDAGGRRLGGTFIAYSSTATPLARPRLPAGLDAGDTVDVGVAGDGDVRYRAAVTASPGGEGTTIVAVPLTGVSDQLDELLVFEAIVIGGVLLLMGGAGIWLVRVGLRPLDRIGATAARIADGDLSQRVPEAGERTEIGRLGRALNAMLHQIEGAFAQREASEQRLRTFLADASHELRTPLASIRGYAELYRMGATTDEAERARAISRIEQEAARMGVLVEDLLVLARLDEVRDAVRRPVDIAELAQDAVADARAAAPDRRISLAIEGEDTLVSGDGDQLRQVLLNLVRNAATHTPEGTPVDVSVDSAAGGSRVRVVVGDHGPGLPDDGAKLFQRFRRGDTNRGSGPAGAGLGLAIVQGIVAAHGGSVVAADAEGGGARFEVLLPALAEARV